VTVPERWIPLYADTPERHDRIAQEPGHFTRTLELLAQGGRGLGVEIPISKFNFFRLPAVARFAAERLGEPIDVDGLTFEPRPLERIGETLNQSMAALLARLNGRIRLGGMSTELSGLLAALEKAAARGRTTESELLRAMGVIVEDVFVGPFTFHLDVSNPCNMDCLFCGLHSPLCPSPPANYPKSWLSRQIDWQLFCNLVDDLTELETKEDVLFSGEGEPLLHPRSIDMIRYVKERGIHLLLFTNGLKLTPENARHMVDLGLDLLYISVNAGTPESFDYLHPRQKAEDFNLIIEQMAYLESLKRKHGVKKPYTTYVLALNKGNVKDVIRVAEICRDIGVDSIRFQIMHSCEPTEFLLLDQDELDQLREDIQTARRICDEAGIHLLENIDFQLPQIKPKSCDWFEEFMNDKGCFAGWKYSRVFTDGRISFCCHTKIVGSLYEQRFKDLWNSEHYNRMRVVSKHSNPKAENFYLESAENEQPGWLLARDCKYCGNYEQSRDIWRTMEQEELLPYLDGIPRTPMRKEEFQPVETAPLPPSRSRWRRVFLNIKRRVSALAE
jgi:MoaA/NifB/PqqE/SkfB family radical SAM enzyme